MKNLRTTGLAMLLLAAGCGDDDGGDDKTPSDDAGIDSGVMIDGGTDSGPTGDSGPTVDSGLRDSGPSGSDSGLDGALDSGTIDAASDGGGDASAEEIMQALNIDGVRADNRRAELVVSAYCGSLNQCSLDADGGTTDEAACRAWETMNWNAGVLEGDTEACLDAKLDMTSCVATAPCDEVTLTTCAPVCLMYESICEIDLEQC